MQELLFSYGTLQKEKVQMELFGRLLTGSNDVLEGIKSLPLESKTNPFFQQVGSSYT